MNRKLHKERRKPQHWIRQPEEVEFLIKYIKCPYAVIQDEVNISESRCVIIVFG